MADDTQQAELARLRAENEALKGRAAKGLNLKVSKKGALSVYGLGRFPCDALQRAMGEASGDGEGHPRVHRGA
jgi:hypothetical protein